MNKDSPVKEYESYVKTLDPDISDRDKKIAVILLAAVHNGTTPDKLAKWSGYPRDLVREIALRMKGGKHWTASKPVILGSDVDYLSDMLEYVTSTDLVPKKKKKKKVPKLEDTFPEHFDYKGSSAPFSVSSLRQLHAAINEYRRPSASSYGISVQKRLITEEEWDRIASAIASHGLAVVMRTSSFGFKLGVDIIKPPAYPGAPVDYIMAIPQDAAPSSIIAKETLSPGEPGWNPVTPWESAWGVFSEWVFTQKNMESVKFSGINMPVRKSDYSY